MRYPTPADDGPADRLSEVVGKAFIGIHGKAYADKKDQALPEVSHFVFPSF